MTLCLSFSYFDLIGVEVFYRVDFGFIRYRPFITLCGIQGSRRVTSDHRVLPWLPPFRPSASLVSNKPPPVHG